MSTKVFYQTFLTATLYPDSDIKTTLHNDVIHYDLVEAEKLLNNWVERSKSNGMIVLDKGIKELRIM